jgi:hypothetical protein
VGGTSIPGIAEGAVSGELFSDPEINSQIRVEILRLQVSSLEWSANATNASLDEEILYVLVESLDVHAIAYLCKVNSDELIPSYVSYLRGAGAALIHNAENRGPLQEPYREDALRQMSESSAELIARKHSLDPDEHEAEIWRSLMSIRAKTMTGAESWQAWKFRLLRRIETKFEARYRHWETNAIERVKVRKGGWLRRLQHQLYESKPYRWPTALEPVHRWATAVRPIGPFTQTGGLNSSPAQGQPVTAQFIPTEPEIAAEPVAPFEQLLPASGVDTVNDAHQGEAKAESDGEPVPALCKDLILAWMNEDGWTNKTLAARLGVTERVISSMRNNGKYHGRDAVTKLANLMGRDPSDLYLP